MKKNAKKHKEYRRKRPEGGSATHKETYTEITTKSRVGVEYKKYKSVILKK